MTTTGNDPSLETLERFMAGKCSREESCLVVRHLLARCLECLSVTRGMWQGATTLRGIEEDEDCAPEAGLASRTAWERS